jgi:hypothetical protein
MQKVLINRICAMNVSTTDTRVVESGALLLSKIALCDPGTISRSLDWY